MQTNHDTLRARIDESSCYNLHPSNPCDSIPSLKLYSCRYYMLCIECTVEILVIEQCDGKSNILLVYDCMVVGNMFLYLSSLVC